MCACGRPAAIRGFCRRCWATQLGRTRRVYAWTPSLHADLRSAYARGRSERSAAITAIQRKTGWPRQVIKAEAWRLGITSDRRAWSAEEDRYLTLALGEQNLTQIAERLGRSTKSVKRRTERLEMSTRIRSGYSISDLTRILGAPRYRVQEWIAKGLLGTAVQTDSGVRVEDDALTRFIRRNAALIDFRLADQTYIKGVLCGEGGVFG